MQKQTLTKLSAAMISSNEKKISEKLETDLYRLQTF